jgi:diguanylate cyclase (GGDEF)-like protein
LCLTLLLAGAFGLFGVARLVRPDLLGGLTGYTDVPALLVLHTALLVLLAWRARRVPTERAVWNRLALGATVFVVALVLVLVLAVVPATRDVGGTPIVWAGVAVFPFWYGALVRWNRYSTSLADPNDVLNGAAAALAVVAVLNVVVTATGSPLAHLPWWELQAQFAQFAVCFVMLGTAAMLPSMGAMGRDSRTWLVIAALTVALAGTCLTLFSGGQRVGWGAVTQPILIACLALAACLRSRRSAPQPTDPGAATIGAFVVIVAATGTLAVSTLTGPVGVATWCAVLATTGAGVRMAVNVREIAQLAATRREALTDELTGLANRRAVLRRVEELCAEETPLALALLDLDKFKEVNDALGHAAGDDLLRRVATRLEAVLRPGDLLGRLGGDEFAVVALMDVDIPLEEAARAVGRRLHDRIAEPFVIGGMSIHSAVSVGVTTSTSGPDDGGQTPAHLLRQADVAMYDAKRSSTGVAVYDRSRHADSSGHLVLVEELRTALAGGQLVLHHQPQLDVATGAIVGVEALVRWQHPARGLLLPNDFLPLAEVHGLMGSLTEVVLAQAVTQAAAWRADGLHLPVSVNLSASNLLDVALPTRVADLLARHDLPPELLVLEVTESVLLTDPERSIAVVGALADLGATVSIDDYGTGYSSLAYLRELPVAELKLDRSFTADLLTDARTEAIVASTVELAHRLGLRVVAEGVEDEATLRHLRSLDCDVSQGYLHARPLPAEQLGCWLAAHTPAVGSPV